MNSITLGSLSLHKLDAVRQACQQLKLDVVVTGIKTSSGQNEQPVGFEETFAGALARAGSVLSQNPNNLAVGIESGIFRFGVVLDIAVVVLLTPDGRQIVTTSQGVQFPDECVKIAEELGFSTTTVGSIVTEKFGGDPTDPHSVLTNGKVTRTMTLVDALVIGLQQL